MKTNFKKLAEFAVNLLKEYLIDKAIGTFLISSIICVASFTLVTGYTPDQLSPSSITATIIEIFKIAGVASFITSLITVFPAIYKIFIGAIVWLAKMMP